MATELTDDAHLVQSTRRRALLRVPRSIEQDEHQRRRQAQDFAAGRREAKLQILLRRALRGPAGYSIAIRVSFPFSLTYPRLAPPSVAKSTMDAEAPAAARRRHRAPEPRLEPPVRAYDSCVCQLANAPLKAPNRGP